MATQPTPQNGNGHPASYRECPKCGFIADADATSCPACGYSGEQGRDFPNARMRKLEGRIRRYHDESEWEIVVILGETFLETLLEDLLDRIIGAHGADVAVRSVVLDSVRAVGARIGRLFPHLTGQEFEAAALELGYRDFPHRWRRMRQARNAFIHDTPYRDMPEELDEASAATAIELMDQSYPLMVGLHNRFVATARPGKGKR